MTTTGGALIQRRGSLIQRRNSKRFVLSELSSVELTKVAGWAKENVENQEKNDFESLIDDSLSDDDEAFKVPDIVLDIQETAVIPVDESGHDESYDSPTEIVEWRPFKTLKDGIT